MAAVGQVGAEFARHADAVAHRRGSHLKCDVAVVAHETTLVISVAASQPRRDATCRYCAAPIRFAVGHTNGTAEVGIWLQIADYMEFIRSARAIGVEYTD